MIKQSFNLMLPLISYQVRRKRLFAEMKMYFGESVCRLDKLEEHSGAFMNANQRARRKHKGAKIIFP